MRYSRLPLAVGMVFLAGQGYAKEYSFDGTLLDSAGKVVDVSLFEQGGQLPGTYTVDVLLNGEKVDSRDIVFNQGKNAAGKPILSPCLSVEDLSRYGVKVEDFPALLSSGDKVAGCAVLDVIPQATVDLNFNSQTLTLLVPQVSMRPRRQGIAPEEQWNDGVPALLLNWQANTSNTENKSNGASQNTSTTYIQLQPGANMGAWRLRNATTWQKSREESGKFQNVYTYAERGLNSMKSRLTLGDRSTPGDIFDSLPFRGVMLNSDQSMVPSGVYSYAPVIRGIARTQARVEVKQNGYSLYNALVAPGPFALNDLAPSGASGDLFVTVYETDGSKQEFIVPYQTPAIALREGYLQYSMMAGQYRPANNAVDKSRVYQTTVMYGLPLNLTAYTGVQVANHYQAGSLGLGVSLGDWGAVSLDGTQTRGQRRKDETQTGQVWRARYSKQVIATDTTFTLAGYQYASSGYNSLSDVLDSWRDDIRDQNTYNSDRRRTRADLTVSQSLGDWGYLNLTGSRQTYWNRPGHSNVFNAGYSILLGGVTTSLNWTENKNTDSSGNLRNDRVTSLYFSVPLDRWLGGNTMATYRWTNPSSGSDTHEAGLNGRAFDRRLNWDVRERYRPGMDNNKSNSALRLGWSGGYGQVGGSYSYNSTMKQMGVDAAGGVVVHPGGVTFGQPLGETVALVTAPGASGVSVGGWPGVRTDWRGYTTLSFLSPYQTNRVSLNPAELPPDAEITQTDTDVIPTQGAVIPAKFNTRIGGRALMTLVQANGTEVPYGALATLQDQNVGAGVVGDAGQVYLTGLSETGELSVKWSGGLCRVTYTLPPDKGAAGLYEMRNVCR
ncbi:fimbria/pilus outer membrane usher protein [Rahnella variigena]|uniref:fimbria/pilus outer membrane usher protein n=1 Tax=Rahnella variigena TaxID=574964 RepID=UPI001330E8CC|nr:fimbria/pilus outer membrane usher protein [Rahnella variigena]